MFAKMLVAWAVIALCLTIQAESQYDPLGTDIYNIPTDLRRTSSLDDDQKVYIDPRADPLGIDPLMRPLDPEHTWEYLKMISSGEYLEPYLSSDLQGNWLLDMLGGTIGKVDLQLFQNQNSVFGRGSLSLGGLTTTLSASGTIAKDVLYLDLVSLEDLKLYRCILTISKDRLSGSYYAFDANGGVGTGTVKARKTG